jgi:hypothetical protein
MTQMTTEQSEVKDFRYPLRWRQEKVSYSVFHILSSRSHFTYCLLLCTERTYPRSLSDIAKHIDQPKLPELVRRFLYDQLNPDSANPGADMPIDECPVFEGRVSVHHSATARFYAPSDLCGTGGMHRERIRSAPSWQGRYARRDTVLVVTDPEQPGMLGMAVGRVFLFFSFTFRDVLYPCALIHWFEYVGREPDADTGMWMVRPERESNGRPCYAVIHINSIQRAAHLIPVYGPGSVPDSIQFFHSLNVFRSYYVNSYADHHMNEFIGYM